MSKSNKPKVRNKGLHCGLFSAVGRVLVKAINIVSKPFRWLFLWIMRFLREFTLVLLFPFKKRMEKKKSAFFARIYKWASKGIPAAKEDAIAYHRNTAFVFLTLILLGAFCGIMLAIFGSPIAWLDDTIDFGSQAISYVSLRFSGKKDLPSFPISELANGEFASAAGNVRSIWYYFQVSCGALTNGDVTILWLQSLLDFALGLLNVINFLPFIVIAFVLLKRFVSTPIEGEEPGRSKTLIWFEDYFVAKIWAPLRKEASLFASWLIEKRWPKAIGTFFVLFISPIGWILFDCIIGYLLIVLGGTLSWVPSFFVTLSVAIAEIVLRVGATGGIAIAIYLAVRINRNAALADLRSMQSSNEDFADSLAVINAINGHVGSGKTTMLSSIATDQEANFRDYYLSVMMKYQSAFPFFPFDKLERYVVKHSTCQITDPTRLATASRLKQALVSLWNAWWDDDFKKVNAAGKEAFFGYDRSYGIRWFDGAKEVLLIDALEAYAESYFMYFSGQKLVTSNYPIAMDHAPSGIHFPIFAPANSYLNGGCAPEGDKSYSHVFDEDFFRIKTPVDLDSTTSGASIGGGVIAMTEASNERGNRFDYVGMSKKDGGANQLNDGWNQAMRLIRHWFMVDGRPCCCFIYDYQREDAMNADARLSAENTIFIQERGEERNALPLWWFTDSICSAVERWWNDIYWYSWRPNHARETLLMRLIGIFCGLFINHRQRMRYSYGYEIATLTRTQGASESETGKKTVEEYYFIYRKVRGTLFKSDVYAPILSQRSLSSNKGWMDQPAFQSVFASPKEFSMEHSFFLDSLGSLFDPQASAKAVRKIDSDAHKKGTE